MGMCNLLASIVHSYKQEVSLYRKISSIMSLIYAYTCVCVGMCVLAATIERNRVVST